MGNTECYFVIVKDLHDDRDEFNPELTIFKVNGEDWRIHSLHGNNAELLIDLLNRKEKRNERAVDESNCSECEVTR